MRGDRQRGRPPGGRSSGSRELSGALYARPAAPTGYPVVVSHIQLAPLLATWHARSGEVALDVETSADLGLSTVTARLDGDGVRYPDGSRLAWVQVAHIIATPNQVFEVRPDGEPQAIARFSATTNALRSLMPTSGAPTMLVSGFSMHRIKGTEPWADTQSKIRALAPIAGRVLDTTTGLGYTALMAARAADEVVTIELDPVGIEIARRNPWSSELFTRPNIHQRIGDAFEVINELPASGFERVIHDPPYLTLAGDLYSEEMYRRLYRVLRPGGRLFHYIGDPASQSGARVTSGVLRRLEAVGFRAISRQPAAFGVSATR
ncbi:MAG TPA: spermine synthase [Ktedonobacterales bacterium]|nr:spermine synthase [Ktedonobacterales bacterium]